MSIDVRSTTNLIDQPLAAAYPGDDLKSNTLRGGLIALVIQVLKFGLRAGSIAILARLLTPNDFGVVAMVTGVTGLFIIFKDVGLSAATVQRETVTHAQISTLFWINIAVGACLASLTMATAPVLVAFYREPRLFGIAMVLGWMFLFTAAGVQHQALLQRRMRFATLGLIEILSLTVSVGIGIGLGMYGYGYWALVGMTLGFPVANALCLWVANPWRPGLPRRGSGARSMLLFGGTVTTNMIVVYLAYNIEKVLLGHYWGADVLGVYSRAQAVINIPTDQLNSAIGSVALPGLSRLQGDEERCKRYFLQGYTLFLSATVPIVVTSLICATEIITILLGPQWIDAVPVFRLLAPTVLALAFINPFGWLLFATGQTRRSLKIACVIAPLVITAYMGGVRYGSLGVAAAYSGMMAALTVPVIVWSRWEGLISLRDVGRAVKQPIIAGLVAGVIGVICKMIVGEGLSVTWRLAVGSGVTLSVYSGVLLYVMKQKDFYHDLVSHLRPRVPRPVQS